MGMPPMSPSHVQRILTSMVMSANDARDRAEKTLEHYEDTMVTFENLLKGVVRHSTNAADLAKVLLEEERLHREERNG